MCLLQEPRDGTARHTEGTISEEPYVLNCQEKLAEAEPLLCKEVETRGGMLGAEHQKYTSAYPTFWPHCQAKLAKGGSLDSGSSGKRRFLGSCFLVLVSWFLLLVSWFLVLVSWFLVLDRQCEHAYEVCSQA